MKHLFMIQAHAQPNLLKRLVERLVSDNHYILIHIDKKQNLSVFKNVIREDDHVRFTEKRINVKWGGGEYLEINTFVVEGRLGFNSSL